ncbi:hypothetical protein [Vibrio lentus]|uniref:hypothetical protein n=1 Tax=Vibrio lentus TaxID=136468 RepID=UPI003D129EB0
MVATRTSSSNSGTEAIEQLIEMVNDVIESLADTLDIVDIFANPNSILVKKFNEIATVTGPISDDWYLSFAQLYRLSEDLKEIKISSPSCAGKLKKDLMVQKSAVQWHGFRFEARLQARLIEKGFEPKSREKPDLECEFKGEKLYIEASSARYGDSKKALTSPEVKLKTTIRNKNKKPYANSSTALAIEFSHLLASQEALGTPIDIQFLKSKLAEQQYKYGAIILIAHIYKNNRYYTLPTVIKSEHCDDKLSDFLDLVYLSNDSQEKEEFVVGECLPSFEC